MNKVKKQTFLDRVKAGWRAFNRRPVGQITYGLEIKRCSDCERGDCETCDYRIHSNGVSGLPDCNDCAKRGKCEYEPDLGAWTRINCPLYAAGVRLDEMEG